MTSVPTFRRLIPSAALLACLGAATPAAFGQAFDVVRNFGAAPGEDGIPAEIREQLAAQQPPPEMRPRIVLRFVEEKDLLVSGMLAGGAELAGKPVVVDVPVGKGHVVMFANNPMWRHETHGSFALLFNAALNFDHLHVGRQAPRRGNSPQAGQNGDQN